RLDALLIVHAEDPGVIAAAPRPAGREYARFLASRPPAAEDTAISRLLAAAGRHGTRVHVLHLASASALPIIAGAQASRVRVSAETCPHYLTFCAEEVPGARRSTSAAHRSATPRTGTDCGPGSLTA